LTKQGTGTLILDGSSTFSGGVTLSGGTLRLTTGAAAGSGAVTQTDASSVLEIDTLDTITNSLSVYQVAFLQGATLSGAVAVNNAGFDVAEGESATISGDMDGEGGVTKTGSGLLTLTGDNSYTGAVQVSAGTLELASTTGGAAAATTAVSVAGGAILLLSQTDQVNDSATVSLSGGTIQRAGGVSEVFGTLTLTTDSFLDFGTGAAGTLSFGAYTPSSLLTVENFGVGNVLTFGSNLTGTINNGSLFSFDNSFNSAWDGGTGTFTITAIPEPSTVLAALLLSALLLPGSLGTLRRIVNFGCSRGDKRFFLLVMPPVESPAAAIHHQTTPITKRNP
jgi:autotransporter-associated beta strand protein